MKWLVFSYSLPTKGGSSSRVTLWRRLQNLGALDVTGVYVLPEITETLEAFTWLTQEVEAAGGEAVVIHTEKLNGLSDKNIIERFNQERNLEYQALLEEIRLAQETFSREDFSERTKTLSKLRRHYDDITRIDFFNSRQKGQVATMLTRLEQTLKSSTPLIQIKLVKVKDYQNKIWVTRPQPYIDRLASIWLIKRFIDKNAVIRYRDKAKADEVSFDMTHATFGHSGQSCTFETLIIAFSLTSNALDKLADIVHDLDLQTGYTQPEASGIEAVLKGWHKQNLSDKELETRGTQLFEGLYQTLKDKV